MLGEPALLAGEDGGDAQRVALLAQQGVAAVAGAVGPDLVGLGEVGDVLLVAARPRHVRTGVAIRIDQRVADAVHGGHPRITGSDRIQRRGADAGHDPHVHHDVGGVGDLDAELADLATERTHRERDHVHRATAHAAGEQPAEGLLHLGRVGPVVGGAGVLGLLRADERPRLHPCDVGRLRAREIAAGTQVLVQLDECSAGHHLVVEAVALSDRPVAPVHGVGLGELCDPGDPGQQVLRSVGGRGVLDRGGVLGHRDLLGVLAAMPLGYASYCTTPRCPGQVSGHYPSRPARCPERTAGPGWTLPDRVE